MRTADFAAPKAKVRRCAVRLTRAAPVPVRVLRYAGVLCSRRRGVWRMGYGWHRPYVVCRVCVVRRQSVTVCRPVVRLVGRYTMCVVGACSLSLYL